MGFKQATLILFLFIFKIWLRKPRISAMVASHWVFKNEILAERNCKRLGSSVPGCLTRLDTLSDKFTAATFFRIQVALMVSDEVSCEEARKLMQVSMTKPQVNQNNIKPLSEECMKQLLKMAADGAFVDVCRTLPSQDGEPQERTLRITLVSLPEAVRNALSAPRKEGGAYNSGYYLQVFSCGMFYFRVEEVSEGALVKLDEELCDLLYVSPHLRTDLLLECVQQG